MFTIENLEQRDPTDYTNQIMIGIQLVKFSK
jgi:hypothetical protein